MKYRVLLVQDAEDDLFEIYEYVARNDSIESARRLISNIKSVCQNLSEYPNRGNIPAELERIGVLDYREAHYKPYKIIYQVMDSVVYVHCVLDGRRSLEELLRRRLLR